MTAAPFHDYCFGGSRLPAATDGSWSLTPRLRCATPGFPQPNCGCETSPSSAPSAVRYHAPRRNGRSLETPITNDLDTGPRNRRNVRNPKPIKATLTVFRAIDVLSALIDKSPTGPHSANVNWRHVERVRTLANAGVLFETHVISYQCYRFLCWFFQRHCFVCQSPRFSPF